MSAPHEIAFFVANRFSLFGYAVASEMFRFANEVQGETIYAASVVSESRDVVLSSNGTQVTPDARFDEAPRADTIVLCSGAWNSADRKPARLLSWLRDHHRHGGSICALATGVRTLAATGLLDGRDSSAHWNEVAALREAFPKARFSTSPMSVSGRIWTCSGGDSVTDMVLGFLSSYHGLAIAAQVRRMILLKPAQLARDQRDILLHDHTSDIELAGEQLLDLIEANIAEPLAVGELCRRLSLPQRTLNRQCHLLFGCSVQGLYLGVRLRHAKMLLANTLLPVTDVASLCGFRTSAHFSAAFRGKFDCTPKGFRNRAGANDRAVCESR